MAVLLLESDLSLSVLLDKLIEEARSMAGAKYGALGVLDEAGTSLSEFLTTGIEPEVRRQIGDPPTGLGVLGLLITDPVSLRLPDIGAHPESYGFPPNHPPMKSFLGVPVQVHDRVYGILYLTEKIGWSEFTRDDQVLVEALAFAAGLAIENARLHERVSEVAVIDDRDRIARDLHDAVIQRLFAIGLSLQGLAGAAVPSTVVDRLQSAIGDIDTVIRQIRTTIFELGATSPETGLRSDILAVVHELGPVVGFTIPVRFDGPVDSLLGPRLGEDVVAVVREALTNAGRHAHATSASVSIVVLNRACQVEIVDDGVGFDLDVAAARSDRTEGGLGLLNLRRRAEKRGGELILEAVPSGGTRLVWRVPLDA
jgi:signal transduction histidine kinase